MFGLVFFYVKVGSLVNFPICIIFFIRILGVAICVVHVELFLDMGVEICGRRWVHNLA